MASGVLPSLPRMAITVPTVAVALAIVLDFPLPDSLTSNARSLGLVAAGVVLAAWGMRHLWRRVGCILVAGWLGSVPWGGGLAAQTPTLLSIPVSDTLVCQDLGSVPGPELLRGVGLHRISPGSPVPPFNLMPREITVGFDDGGRLLFLHDHLIHSAWYAELAVVDLTDMSRPRAERSEVHTDSAAALGLLLRGALDSLPSLIRTVPAGPLTVAEREQAMALGAWLWRLPCVGRGRTGPRRGAVGGPVAFPRVGARIPA